jgi:hypothetical protein
MNTDKEVEMTHEVAEMTPEAAGMSDDELFRRAVEAYVFAFPLVLMDLTREVATGEGEGRAPLNTIAHHRRYPDASFTDIVRPNADTLYSTVWYDVTTRPLLISTPATGDRYYVWPLMDMWTDVFASIGSRTTGTGAQRCLVVGPGWSGTAPEGVRVITSPTGIGWILGRIQTNGAADYPTVHALQDGFAVESVDIGTTTSPTGRGDFGVDRTTAPVTQALSMEAGPFFERFNGLLAQNPPHLADQAQLARLEVLGLGPDFDFVFDSADRVVRDVLRRAIAVAQRRITRLDNRLSRVDNGWAVRPGIGNYGVDYVTRAGIAYVGLGALPPAEAIYPSVRADEAGVPLTGAHRYELHFDAGHLPPAGQFWSLTMYGHDQFFVDNPIDRYAIGDRDALHFNDDGSLDLYIQHESPGAKRDSNWLPAPSGRFTMNLRLYLPSDAAINGDWTTPPVRRAD